MLIPHIETRDGMSAFLCGRQYLVSSALPFYENFVRAIEVDEDEVKALEIYNSALTNMSKAIEVTPDISIVNGRVQYKGEPIETVLSERMVSMLEQKKSMQYMVSFLDNLMQNPSFRATEQLYPFLEFGNIPITPDGHFLAYKAVRPDYRDIHSGKFDNSIGAKPSMPRNRVDEDPNRTCSSGLHVCSFDYLPSFAHANGHVMVVKVNPRDVVAVPTDYNNTKMRVCAYEVVGEHENYYVEHPECAFNEAVMGDEGEGESGTTGDDCCYRVEEYLSQENVDNMHYISRDGRHDYSLEDAKRVAQSLAHGSFHKIIVRNCDTDEIVQEINNNS